MGSLPEPQPYRILIAGGAYGGVSAAVNLLDLSLGKYARLDPDKAPAEEARDGIPIEIHIVDERDGYCEIELCLTSRISLIFWHQITLSARLLLFPHYRMQQKHGGSSTISLHCNIHVCA